MVSKDELRSILEAKILKLENSAKKANNIDEETVKKLCKNLSLGSAFEPLVHKYFSLHDRPTLIWIHLCECTGCSESLLRTADPSFAELIFDLVSLEHHETTMAACSWQSEDNLERIFKRGGYIVAFEGSGCEDGYFSVGPKAHFANELAIKAMENAAAVFAIGSCSSFGGIQTISPNPIKGVKIQTLTDKTVVNIAGCPPSDINIISSFCYFLLFDRLLELDHLNRPVLFYGKCLHDLCERKSKYESGLFASSFDDERVKDGYCLFKLGCKGPYTFNNCPKVKFNAKTSWPVQAGHGCIACSEPDFWDEFGSYEEPLIARFAYGKSVDMGQRASLISDADVQIVFKKGQTKILKNGEDIFSFRFDNNPKAFLASFAKTKMAKSLVDEYTKLNPAAMAAVAALNEDELPSFDTLDICAFVYFLMEGKKLDSISSFLEIAKDYPYKHISNFDFKLSFKDEKWVLDVGKALRFPMIYSLGGLDAQAIFHSCISSIARELVNAAKQAGDNIGVVFEDESLKGSVLDSELFKAINKTSCF